MGYYYNASSVEQNLVVPITGGTLGAPTTATPPSGYEAGDAVRRGERFELLISLDVRGGWRLLHDRQLLRAGAGGDHPERDHLVRDIGSGRRHHQLHVWLPPGEFERDNQNAVDCGPSGSCLATGWYYTSYGSSTYAGLEQEVSASGQIGTAQAAPARGIR